LLGFWQHRDNKNNEERKAEEKENNLPPAITPARFYRQNPYFVVDVPLGNAGRTAQAVTHVQLGSTSASSNANLYSVRQNNSVFPTTLTPLPSAGAPAPVPHSWAEIVGGTSTSPGPRRLRIWKPLSSLPLPQNELTDSQWFNNLNVQLVHIDQGATNRTILSRVQINIRPPANTWVPSYSDMIRYEQIPIEPPAALAALQWPTLFDFQPTLIKVNLLDTIEFTPPATYLGNSPLELKAYRFADATSLTLPPPRDDVVVQTLANGKIQVRFPADPDDNPFDLFVIEMYRRQGTVPNVPAGRPDAGQPILIGPVATFPHSYCLENPEDPDCLAWFCSVDPELDFCGGGALARMQAVNTQARMARSRR
jgi:hypothetical protein